MFHSIYFQFTRYNFITNTREYINYYILSTKIPPWHQVLTPARFTVNWSNLRNCSANNYFWHCIKHSRGPPHKGKGEGRRGKSEEGGRGMREGKGELYLTTYNFKNTPYTRGLSSGEGDWGGNAPITQFGTAGATGAIRPHKWPGGLN